MHQRFSPSLTFALLVACFTMLFINDANAQTQKPKIAAGWSQSLVLTDDGTVYTFGAGNYGVLGLEDIDRVEIATPITHSNLEGKKIIGAAAGGNEIRFLFTLLLAEDSTVYSFGTNRSGQLGHGDWNDRSAPTKIDHPNIAGKKFIDVAACVDQSFLVASDGSVYAMGNNSYGYLGTGVSGSVTVPTMIDTTNLAGNKITKIVCSTDHELSVLMLSDSNHVFGLGKNANGQLGDGTRNSQTIPVRIPKSNFDNKTIVDFQMGLESTMALASDGTVYSWGNFRNGLGHGTLQTDLLSPTPITHSNLSGKTITKIAKMSEDALLLASDGTVFIFGAEFRSKYTQSDVPVEITSSAILGKTITSISIGQYHVLIGTSDGLVYGFGQIQQRNNVFGVGTFFDVLTPIPINDKFIKGKEIHTLISGGKHNLIIDSNGVAYSFGGDRNYMIDYNSITHLGREIKPYRETPTKLSHANLAGETIVDVKAGGDTSFLLTESGKVFGFGSRPEKLGTGDIEDVFVPTQIAPTVFSGKKVIDVASSLDSPGSSLSLKGHTLFLTEDGSLFATGNNDEGQLGLGDQNNRNVPTQITHANLSDKTIVDISVGAENSMAIASDGTVFIWGAGNNGEMGYGNTNSLLVPTPAPHVNNLGKTFIDGAIGQNLTLSTNSLPHFVLIANDSSVVSFGENFDGQLGIGSKTDSYTPRVLPSSSIQGKKPVKIIAGYKFTMLLTDDGSVFSWGNTHAAGINGSFFRDETSPVLLSSAEIGGRKAIDITAQYRHGLIVVDDGSVLSLLGNGTELIRAAAGNGLPNTADNEPHVITNFNWRTSPIPTTNLALHLDAGRGLTTFGDSLNTWGNLGSSGNNGTQTNLARRAVVVDSAINNQRVIRFNGTDSYMTLPKASNLGILNSDYELFMVAKSASSGINFLMGGQALGQFELQLNGSAGARFIPAPTPSKYVDVGAAGDFTDGTPQLMNLQASGTYGKLTLNRSQTTTNSTDTRSTSDGDIYLGVRTDNSFSFNGDMAEVIIYNSILSDADRGKVEEYLVSKYAIPNKLNATFTLTGTQGWRLLASPVADSSFAPLLDNIWTQGFTGAKTENGSPNVYTWDATSATGENTNWKALMRMDTTMQPGSAALVYVFSDDNYDEPGDAGFPKTLTVQGVEPLGTQSLSGTLNPNVNGFTLLGNPFRYDIDWDAFTKTGLSNSVYVYDHNASGWKSWNGTLGSLSGGVIGAYNGFFVQTQAGSPGLSIADSAKTYATEAFLGKEMAKADPSYLSLELKSESGFTNKAWVQFSEEGDVGLDASDALQMTPLSSNYVTLASLLNDTTHLDINSLPVMEEEIEIPLVLQTTEAGISHSITKGDWNLPEGSQLTLHDSELDITTDLSAPYVFTINAGKARQVSPQAPPNLSEIVNPVKRKQDAPRFVVRISLAQTVDTEPDTDLPTSVELMQNYPNPFNPSTTIMFGVPETGKVTLEVFDVMGRKVATLLDGDVRTAGRHSVQFTASQMASGIYIYRLRVGNEVLTKKLTLIK